MVKRIFFSAISAAILAIIIVSAIFRWYVPGYILFAVSIIWFGFNVFRFCTKVSLWGLAAVGALVALFVCGWLPIALTGFGNLTAFEILLIGGAGASALTIPFYFV